MKKTILAGLAMAVAMTFGMAQAQVKQDMKDAGHSTADAGKDVGRGTKVAAKKTAHGTTKVAKKTGHGTKLAATKTADASKTGYHKTVNGTKKVGDKIAGKPTDETPKQ